MKKILLVTIVLITVLACGGTAQRSSPIQELPTLAPTVEPTSTLAPTPEPTSTTTPVPSPVPTEPDALSRLQIPACVPRTSMSEIATVTKIVDGDTIDVVIDGAPFTVRYIGIDTPEIDQPDFYGQEAANKNTELVANKNLIMVKDVSETDQFGRLLRYVFVDDGQSGVFVNSELVRQGYAKAVVYPPDVACEAYFSEDEGQARAAGLGLWSPAALAAAPTETQAVAAPVSGNVAITTIFYDGNGQNEPDEYVEIRNDSGQALQLQGWSLEDKANHIFFFPEFTLQPGQVCRIYTNEVHPDTCGFSFNYTDSAIWNNGGDCAYLKDASGAPVTEYCYSG